MRKRPCVFPSISTQIHVKLVTSEYGETPRYLTSQLEASYHATDAATWLLLLDKKVFFIVYLYLVNPM